MRHNLAVVHLRLTVLYVPRHGVAEGFADLTERHHSHAVFHAPFVERLVLAHDVKRIRLIGFSGESIRHPAEIQRVPAHLKLLTEQAEQLRRNPRSALRDIGRGTECSRATHAVRVRHCGRVEVFVSTNCHGRLHRAVGEVYRAVLRIPLDRKAAQLGGQAQRNHGHAVCHAAFASDHIALNDDGERIVLRRQQHNLVRARLCRIGFQNRIIPCKKPGSHADILKFCLVFRAERRNRRIPCNVQRQTAVACLHGQTAVRISLHLLGGQQACRLVFVGQIDQNHLGIHLRRLGQRHHFPAVEVHLVTLFDILCACRQTGLRVHDDRLLRNVHHNCACGFGADGQLAVLPVGYCGAHAVQVKLRVLGGVGRCRVRVDQVHCSGGNRAHAEQHRCKQCRHSFFLHHNNYLLFIPS